MWLGGWRPSCALMLVYSLMGVQLRDEIRSFGLGIKNLVRSEAVLSDKQLISLRTVQNRARDEEKKLSKKLASIQVTSSVPIPPPRLQLYLELTAALNNCAKNEVVNCLVQMLLCDQDVVAAVMVDSAPETGKKIDLKAILKPRISRLKKLLIQADHLRLQTLHQLFLVLSPIQVAHCAIAAFELAFSMHALGLSDESRIQTGSLIPCAEPEPEPEPEPVPPKLPSSNAFGFDPLQCVFSSDNHARESVMLCHRHSCTT